MPRINWVRLIIVGVVLEDEVSTGSVSNRVSSLQEPSGVASDPVASAPDADSITSNAG
jgi:hypothetical protein